MKLRFTPKATQDLVVIADYIRLVPLEIDDPLHPLVARAAESGGYFALVVPPAGTLDGLHERLFRLRAGDLRVSRDRPESAAGRSGLILS